MAREESQPDSLAEVPVDAHRHGNFVTRARSTLTWLILSGAGIFWTVEYGLRGEARYLPGALTNVHASWENRCEVCHVDSAPVGGNNWLATLSGRTHAADTQCQTCHSGPDHHVSQRAGEVAGCTTCHNEHRGRQASLTRVADAFCLGCHRDLAHHVDGGNGTAFLDIPDFSAHPEFRILRDKAPDPGRIAFDHALHMKKGLRHDAASPVSLTLASIPAIYRDRYRRSGQPDSAPVQLDCASCHRTDNDPAAHRQLAGLPTDALLPARPAGRSMLPIVYEMHCQACHPLSFATRSTDSMPVSVKHRQQPAEIRTFLEGHFARELLERDHSPQPRSAPLPTRHLLSAAEKSTLATQIADRIQRAEKILYGPNTCGQCHRGALEHPPRIEPAGIPQVWFTQARFDHTSHRAVDCRQCHPGVYAFLADGRHGSRSHKDVLLPGIDICRQCHGPATTVAGEHRGGTRFDCVQCHRYHGGDQPLHGRGANTRTPAITR